MQKKHCFVLVSLGLKIMFTLAMIAMTPYVFLFFCIIHLSIELISWVYLLNGLCQFGACKFQHSVLSGKTLKGEKTFGMHLHAIVK